MVTGSSFRGPHIQTLYHLKVNSNEKKGDSSHEYYFILMVKETPIFANDLKVACNQNVSPLVN